jgi:Ser/Thr protein kinase RdoA (MazF antagonist)
MHAPGALVGTGRTADVFEFGNGLVLRRYRDPRDTEREAAAMEHARSHGFPAPAARALDDRDMVLERVSGPTMLSDLMRRPWRVPRHAKTLADLHRRLQAVPAPDWLSAPFGAGDSLLHLDLHPDNVILSPAGPIVIDWPNAVRGPGPADVAHTWIVLACSLPPAGRYRQAVSLAGRRAFLELFLRRVDREQARARIPEVGTHRMQNRVLPEAELAAIRRMVEKKGHWP